MPPFGPIKYGDLIRYLRQAGYSGPYSGGKHPCMRRGTFTLTIPNPHRGDIGINLLAKILKQAQIDKSTWEAL